MNFTVFYLTVPDYYKYSKSSMWVLRMYLNSKYLFKLKGMYKTHSFCQTWIPDESHHKNKYVFTQVLPNFKITCQTYICQICPRKPLLSKITIFKATVLPGKGLHITVKAFGGKTLKEMRFKEIALNVTISMKTILKIVLKIVPSKLGK